MLGLDLGYRWVTNPGEGDGLVRSPEYFPGANVSYALDAAASVGVRSRGARLVSASTTAGSRSWALRGATLNAPGGTDAYTALSLSVMGEFRAAEPPLITASACVTDRKARTGACPLSAQAASSGAL